MIAVANSVLGTPPDQYDQKYMQNVIGALNRAFRRYDSTASVTTNTVLNGKGAPLSSLGNNGDFYIDTLAESIYGPKVSGAWGNGVLLKGPAGKDGIIGSNGAAGAAGATGATGATGPAGSLGAAPARIVTANDTFALTDYAIYADASGGAITVLLRASPATGLVFELSKTDSTANAVTLGGNGNTINGNSSIVITYTGTSLEVQFNGVEWRLI